MTVRGKHSHGIPPFDWPNRRIINRGFQSPELVVDASHPIWREISEAHEAYVDAFALGEIDLTTIEELTSLPDPRALEVLAAIKRCLMQQEFESSLQS